MMRLKFTFIMIILAMSTQLGWTQGAGVIYEGTQQFYKVNAIEGNSYAWEVYRGNDPPDPGVPGDFEFIGDPSMANIGVQWNIAGIYYLTVTCTDTDGCSNKKAMAVQVVPNDRMISLVELASEACFDVGGNEFDLSLAISGTLHVDEFPLTLNYTVNGVWFSDVIESNDLVLRISEPDFIADPQLETMVVVEIKGAIDAFGIAIEVDPDKQEHNRTIFPVPVIEFTEELIRTYYDLIHEANTAFTYHSASGVQLVEPN